MFDAVNVFRERIGSQDVIEVVHGSHIWTAAFEWKPPGGEQLENILNLTTQPFPKDYVQFLKTISNGCLLYHDKLYGQWGFYIYSIEELTKKQVVWKERLGDNWQENFLVFAEMRGESDGLLFDLNKPSFDMSSFTIYDANPMDTVNDWLKVSRSFHEWLDHLITAQGDKFWEWI